MAYTVSLACSLSNLKNRNMPYSEIDHRSIAVIKGLAMDAPHAAKSGHQGTAMALAPLAHVLWSIIMNYDPK